MHDPDSYRWLAVSVARFAVTDGGCGWHRRIALPAESMNPNYTSGYARLPWFRHRDTGGKPLMAMDIPGVSTPPAQGGHASGSIRRAGLIRAFGLLFASLLTACSNLAGPEYKRPDAPGKDTWLQEQSARSSAQEGIESEWWTGFEDPVLDELVSRAIAGNLDIRVLAARSDVARAAIGQARAGLLPTIEGGMATDTFKSTGVPSTTKYSTASEAN